MAWNISQDKNGGYPYLPFLPEPTKFKFELPYPEKLFRSSANINNGYPYLTFLPEPKKFEYEPPYPEKMFRLSADVNDGYPYLPIIERPGGAFKDAVNLTRADIPQSCKKIGKLAFANTALKKVKIAADCEYSPTSFPEGCEVEFYGEGGSFGQLYDKDGFAILDADSTRIYVKE